MISVTLLYPNGQRRDVLLAGVPHPGTHVRPENGPSAPSLVVLDVLYVPVTATPEPNVIVSVRVRDN